MTQRLPKTSQPARPPSSYSPASRSSRTLALKVALAFGALGFVILVATTCTNSAPESGGIESGGIESSLGIRATVQRVVDGDTIIVVVNDKTETVRLLGIDTPEKAGGPRPAECFGQQASDYVSALLPPDTAIWLSRDTETRDQYSRLLGYVHRVEDSLFVNRQILQAGYASPLFFAPNLAFEADFQRAADTARREWRGFWPECGAPNVTLEPE